MNELNEKLARLAGLHFFPECECIRVKGICWGEDERTYGVDGKHHFVLPRFTESTDACFEHLVPKLAEEGFVVTVGSYECSGYYAYAYYMFNREPEEFRAETPALALCKAVEQLLEKA